MEFILITGRTMHQGEALHAKCTEEYVKACAVCEMNPEDMKALGVKEGDVVRVKSDAGEVDVYVKRCEGLDRGIVFIPMGPWANALIPKGTDSTGMPSFKGIKVKIEKSSGKVLRGDELVMSYAYC